jgi:acyl dehydratase
MSHVTDEVRALIGVTGPKRTAPHPLGPDALRRFVQGAMETDPIHWDVAAAAARGHDGVVATPLYPVNAFPRPDGAPDPLERLVDDPEWDGSDVGAGLGGLPPVEIALKRVLNGGVDAEFHQLARVGDVISSQSRYLDIVERDGRSGTMVLVTVETTYTNQDDAVLLRVRSTIIIR